jgi:D-serine deaminase-like pyridoxal phosphate-dependent protein
MPSLFNTILKPTLLLDEATARANIRRMAQRAAQRNVRLRPHFKTHQSAQIGSWFREENISAITVSSVEMAQYFARHGWEDITIAFPANIRQAGEIAALARQVRLGVLVESIETVECLRSSLDSPVDVWLKVDVGAHRTGLSWEHPSAALPIARAVQDAPGLRLRGLLTHAGHTYAAANVEEVRLRYTESVARIHSVRQFLQSQNFGILEVSVGDTPSASLCDDWSTVDEARPGNFVFYDAQQARIGACQWSDIATALACPVVARHEDRGEVIIYGGAIHFSKDYLVLGEQRAYGLVCLPEEKEDGERVTAGWGAPLDGAYVSGLSQEHGIVRLAHTDIRRVQVGDLLCILPAHSCLAVTLMKRFLSLSGAVIDTMNV